MTELRECPFCGGDADWDNSDSESGSWIYCVECGVKSIGGTDYNDTIAAWNRRADDWQDIETCPLDEEGLVWVADGGSMQPDGKRAGRIAFGRVSVYADLPRKAYANGYSGDWLITAWRPLPKGPGG